TLVGAGRYEAPGDNRLWDTASPTLPVFENLTGRIIAWGAHDATPRMRPRTTEIEVANGGAIARPAGHRAEAEELVQAQLTMENVAAGETILPLHVQRRDNLAMHDSRADIRGIGHQRVEAVIGEALLEVVPRALAQGIRGILHKDRHEMLPRWGEGIVVHGWNGDFKERLR